MVSKRSRPKPLQASSKGRPWTIMPELTCRWKARACAWLTPRGKIVRECKVASEPEALVGCFCALGLPLSGIGLEAGPLSQWLCAGMRKAGFAVELLETRHVRAAFQAMPVKTDRKDARGIAELVR